VNKLVWADDEHQAKVDPAIDEFFQRFPDAQLREVLLTRLAERMFDEAELSKEEVNRPIPTRRRRTRRG
jgi:K+-sensing histidine kinase KdpD